MIEFRLHRRRILQVGSLGLAGLGLPELLKADAARQQRRAKSCVLFFMCGGASQLDMFDMKPQASAEIRGPFQPIASSVPGMQVCEHLPRLSRQMHHFAQIRSMQHEETIHPQAVYQMLTGYEQTSSLARRGSERVDMPHMGSAFAQADPLPATLPKFIRLPDASRIGAGQGEILRGQDGGVLPARFDPFPVDISPEGVLAKPELGRLPEISPDRLADRTALLRSINGQLDSKLDQQAAARHDAFEQQAMSILGAPSVQRAFDLEREPETQHDKYGRHRQGQSLLLARRLVEAGARFVSVYWGPDAQDWADGQGVRVAGNPWDTHRNHFPILSDNLFPRFDQSLAALVEDLSQRGLLDETLLVWLSDFGRTPRISQPWASRDHWPAAFTVLLAGAGIPGGKVIGSTDKIAAEVTDRPVSPADLTATIFAALGLEPSGSVLDSARNPHTLSQGKVVNELW